MATAMGIAHRVRANRGTLLRSTGTAPREADARGRVLRAGRAVRIKQVYVDRAGRVVLSETSIWRDSPC
jgi:hypothetical protein